MRIRKLILIGLVIFGACAPEFVPPSSLDQDENTVILPTGEPNGRSGAVVASFLSSEHNLTFANSAVGSDTFRISYVTTAQNFDVFKWIFEGGYTTVGSSSLVSGTTTIEGRLDDGTSDQIAVLVDYPTQVGRYDVTHAVANANSFDVNHQKDYVTYDYLDNLRVQDGENTIGWENPQNGWFGPSASATVTFQPCENALVGYYENDNLVAPGQASYLIKDFTNFGSSPKNLVFEYKIDFLVLPNTNETTKKISLGYTPLFSETASLTVEPGELWSDSTYNVTEFRQVILPLPLISDFRLTFTKFPSSLNAAGEQRFPFSVCVRNIKIIPSYED